jgi:hypothetical protein
MSCFYYKSLDFDKREFPSKGHIGETRTMEETALYRFWRQTSELTLFRMGFAVERGPFALYMVWLGMVSYQCQSCFRSIDSPLCKYLGHTKVPSARR